MTRVSEREYYTVAEAAAFLDVSRTTIWRWIAEGRLRAYRAGPRTVRVRQEELRRLLRPAVEARMEVEVGMRQGVPEEGYAVADIWAHYNVEKAKAALKAGVGTLAGVDTQELLKDIHKARAQRSRGRPT